MAIPQEWTCTDDGSSSVIATAIHAGHGLRPEVADLIALEQAVRGREEDLHTDRFTLVAPSRIVVNRSRFEVDVNRPRDGAVYRDPGDAWGLDLWREPWPDDVTARSLDAYDRFYRMLDRIVQTRISSGTRFLVLDIHSYNHRRAGPNAPPEDGADYPDLNVGTGSVDQGRWGTLVHDFISGFRSASGGLDVRENVRFRGGHMSKWINGRSGEQGCCLALEFKKTFMDEWSGEVFEDRISELISALATTIPYLEDRVAAA
jgi:N-formylglutamate deformylase